MTKIKILAFNEPASDPELIKHLRNLLREAHKRKIEFVDIDGRYDTENKYEGFFSYSWPNYPEDDLIE